MSKSHRTDDLVKVYTDTIVVLNKIVRDLSEQNSKLSDELSRLRGTNSL